MRPRRWYVYSFRSRIVVGEGDGQPYLKERGQRAGCAAQASEYIVAGGAPLMDCDVEVYCDGVVLDC